MTRLLQGLAVRTLEQAPPDAPRVVLVHGLGGAGTAWALVAPLLAPDHRLALVDLPGHGDAPALPDPQDMRPAALGARVHRLARALREEDGQPVHLVGHSLGGWVCLEAAADAATGERDDPGTTDVVSGAGADVIAGVIAFTPAGLWVRPRRRPPLLPTGQQFARLAHRLPLDLVPTRLGRWLAFAATSTAPHRLPADVARDAVAAVAAAAGYAAADAGIAGGTFTRGHGITVPVTVVAGSRDRVLPPRHLLRSCAPPQTRWLTWDCGHVPAWDRPGDCADLVREQVARDRARAHRAPRP